MILTDDFHKLAYLAIIFVSLAIALPIVLPTLPRFSFWLILLTLAAGWFAIQLKINWKNKKVVKKAFTLGLFLMVFDFIFENLGAMTTIFGTSWRSFYSSFFVLNVPLEIMLVTLLGGAAWALYLPKKFNFYFSVADISLFATYGMIGEYILSNQGLMQFAGGWNPLDFIAYFVTWTILHFLVYRVIKIRS